MWLHGDQTICNLPPRSDELGDSPPPFFTGGALQGECQHGNSVTLMAVPGLVCPSCGGGMDSIDDAMYKVCFDCHAEGRKTGDPKITDHSFVPMDCAQCGGPVEDTK